MSAGTRERVVRFGPHQGLAGILSMPRTPRPGAPHVVLVNAGIVHRVGPNRLYVDVARKLAALGHPVLRFDLSGLGDSDAVTGGTSLGEAAVADVVTAMDHLERTRGATSFVIGGLCSGANYSLMATIADPRVVGALLLDPTVARTRRSTVVHLARRLRHTATWGALLTLRHPFWHRSLGSLRSVAAAQAAYGQNGQRPQQETRQPSEREIRASLERIIARGVQLMLVFTGGVNHVYNYRGQLFDLLPGLDFRDQLRLEFMPETDHTISDGPSRAQLLEAIGDWAARALPDAAPAAPAAPAGEAR